MGSALLSEGPLVRRPISPKARYSEGPLVRKLDVYQILPQNTYNTLLKHL